MAFTMSCVPERSNGLRAPFLVGNVVGTKRDLRCLSARREYDARMSRVHAATSVGILCLALAACPSSRGGAGGGTADTTPKEAADRAVRIAIARAEGKRADGVRELEQFVRTADRSTKILALRGLGRIGGPEARVTLLATMQDPDPDLVAAAMAAFGVARELEDASVDDGAAAVPALHAAFDRTTGAGRVLAIEAIGRAGDQRSQALLVAQLAADPQLAEATGVALARHGRRKIELTPEVRNALIGRLADVSERRRYGAVYALARSHVPTPVADSIIPLRLGELATADVVPEIRAQAILAIVKYAGVPAAQAQLERALLDRDWRVAVEAVRALTSDAMEGNAAEAVAVALARRRIDLDAGADAEAHVIMEGLRGLQKWGARTVVHDALKSIVTWATSTTKTPALTRAWIGCLATSALVRGDNKGIATAEACSNRELPDHLRLPLVADLVTANTGTLAERRTALATLLAHKDVRVRAAGLGALTAPWKEGNAGDHTSAIGILVGALASKEPILAGTAVDAAAGFYEAIGTGDHAAIDAAVIARATTEKDAELSGSLLELIGKQKLAAGVEACRAGLTGIPVRAKAARGCLRALGEPANDPPAPAHAPAPPVDVGNVIGTSLEWHLETTRGEIVIALAPEVAPWAVASIVALTTSGKYDDLEFHRVVPDFVVQGGDPTESGWGGPGYALPAEPGTTADGAGYVAGGVGMADAGKDSGGSQWFIMHARAAHLDGRYTWVGAVQSGQKSADALLIGDKVVKATITVKSAPRR
jgi:peptidylprolyl isomerase